MNTVFQVRPRHVQTVIGTSRFSSVVYSVRLLGSVMVVLALAVPTARAVATPVPPLGLIVSAARDAPAPTAQPLAALSPAAAEYLTTRAGSVAVAVAIPERGTVYAAHGSTRYPLLSLAKVGIMLTVLQQGLHVGRRPTGRELALLAAMMATSSNDAAASLWTEVGGGAAVQDYLRALGLGSFAAGTDPHWGTSIDSAPDVAWLLGSLANSAVLDASRRALALVLMSRVDATQRWGITAGLPPAALVAFKNGWEETAPGNWTLHSAGIVLPGTTRHAYSIAILTAGQPSLAYGLETIQQLARLVHGSVAAATGAQASRPEEQLASTTRTLVVSGQDSRTSWPSASPMWVGPALSAWHRPSSTGTRRVGPYLDASTSRPSQLRAATRALCDTRADSDASPPVPPGPVRWFAVCNVRHVHATHGTRERVLWVIWADEVIARADLYAAKPD